MSDDKTENHCCSCFRSEDRTSETVAIIQAAVDTVEKGLTGDVRGAAESLLTAAFKTAERRLSPSLDQLENIVGFGGAT